MQVYYNINMLKKRSSIESYDDLCIGDKLIIHCDGNPYIDKSLVQVLTKTPFNSYSGRFGDAKNSIYEVNACGGFQHINTLVVLNMEDFVKSSGMYNENLFNFNKIFPLKFERYFE